MHQCSYVEAIKVQAAIWLFNAMKRQFPFYF